MVSLATSRIASATRASRKVFMRLLIPVPCWLGRPSHFDFVIDELGHGVTAERLNNLLQGSPHRPGLVADHGHAEHRQLTLVLRLDLGHRDIKLVPQAVLDTPDHLSLV